MDNNNQPAFPLIVPDGDPRQDGLTKREYFAGLAMQGQCANLSVDDLNDVPLVPGNVAKWAVAFADALLLELSKTTKP